VTAYQSLIAEVVARATGSYPDEALMPGPVLRAETPSWRKRQFRLALRRAQFGRCAICGGNMKRGKVHSIDHVVPQSRGGRDVGNLVLAHRPCNEAKANREPTGCELIWLAAVNARLEIAL